MVNQEKLADFRDRAMNPDHPTVSGTNQMQISISNKGNGQFLL